MTTQPIRKNKLPIRIPYSDFKNQSSRLSLKKSLYDTYDEVGTIYHAPSSPVDVSKWTFEFDPDKPESKIENRYGSKVNSGGDPNGQSEILTSGDTSFPGSVSANIKDAGASANANRAHNNHEQFKQDFETAMRLNNYQSTGMINNTKRKEIIDLLATGRNEEIEQFLMTTSKPDEFKENSKLKYEQRYKNNKTHRDKKRISDFRNGSALKEDTYNKLYPISEEYKTESKPEEITWKDWDFIPFVLHDLVNKKYLPFRSFINSINDQSDAEWQDVRYLGRADTVQIYTGFARTLSIDFTTVAFTLEELHPMWQRLNYLVGLTKPSGYTTYANDEANIPTNMFVIPPFIKFNLGDMYQDQPSVLTSVSLTIPQEASWELTPDRKSKNEYEFLNKTIVKSEKLLGQYPDMATVSLSFKLLEKRLPKTNNRHFGHHSSEDTHPNVDNGPDIKQGFNYNLIYPNPENPSKSNTELEIPNEIPDSPPIQGKEGDPFQGEPGSVCTTFPPSQFYVSRGNRTKKQEARIKAELDSWKQCACEETAKLMGEENPSPSTTKCTWKDDCIEAVNGKPVPLALKCKYTTASNEDPIEEENPKPNRCPEPGADIRETSKNINSWVKELADYIATEMNLPKIGEGPYTYNDKPNTTFKPSEIKKVSSANGSVYIDFDNGNPFSYSGTAINRNIKNDFKIDCDETDTENEIREIAGNIQPKIMVDTSSDFKIIIDESRKHYIDKNNYKNIEEIKSMMASWVSTQMAKIYSSSDASNTWKDSSINLNADWNEWPNYDLYYIPYEEDAEKMITGFKVFPGTSEYVNYEVNNNVGSDLGIGGSATANFAEIKIGFYAIVSKSEEKLSETQPDQWLENALADELYKRFVESQTAETLIESLGDGSEFENEKSTREFLNPNNSVTKQEELTFLQNKLRAEERADAQLLDENVICMDYSLVGEWNTDQASVIMNRMKDFNYQSVIASKRRLGQPRIMIENYVLILQGTTEDDIRTADAEYRRRANNGKLILQDDQLAKYTDVEFLKTEIEILLKEIKELDNAPPTKNEKMKNGVFFGDANSSSHFVGWMRDHKYDKIQWKDGSASLPPDPRPGRTPKVIPAPVPVTDTPTPNTKPTWTWKPVDSAIQYEVEFKSFGSILEKKIISDTFFTPTDHFPSLKKGLVTGALHTISVKAGRRSHSGGAMEWSSVGKHTVKIDRDAIPPKPPRCPYKVMDVGEKDENGRLVGPASYEEKLSVTIERNIKTWMGDVMAYILAKEELGSLSYPTSPDEVSWSSSNTVAISKSGRHQLEWKYNGKDITNLGYEINVDTLEVTEIKENGSPLKLNGTKLSGYDNEFDCGCGPNLHNDADSGSESNKKPSDDLDAPFPSSNEETDNLKPKWTWTAIRGANMYESSLQKISRETNWTEYAVRYNNQNSQRETKWNIDKDFGIIQYSEYEEVTPPMGLEVGTYRISVVAIQEENGQIVKRSKAGTHIVRIVGGGTPTPTPTPTPTGDYIKLIKPASKGNDIVYVNDRSCMKVRSKITIGHKETQEEAVVIGFTGRNKYEYTESVIGGVRLGSYTYYHFGEDPRLKIMTRKSNQIYELYDSILKLRNCDTCSEDELNKLLGYDSYNNTYRYKDFDSAMSEFNNSQTKQLNDDLLNAIGASIARGSADAPAEWFFYKARDAVKSGPRGLTFNKETQLITKDSNIFGTNLKEILNAAIELHKETEEAGKTATGEGPVFLESKITGEHKKFTKVVCGEAQPVSTPTPVTQPIPTPSPIRSLATPKPSTNSPTSEFEVEWNWSAIENANEYDIAIRKMNESNGRLTIVWEKQRTPTKETKHTEIFTEQGFYEIAVVAKNNVLKIDSDEGTHQVLIDESVTPTPTPTPTPTTSPTDDICETSIWDLYLEDESGYCPSHDKSALSKWWGRSIEYAVCRWWKAQPTETHDWKGKHRIWEIADSFDISPYINEFGMTEEEFHNPQNITASSKIRRSENYHITARFSNGRIPKQGFEVIEWSELYPYWSAKGFARFDPSKGEQCPFSEPETPTSQFECPEIISDLNEYPGYCPNPSDEVALEYWKQVIKYYLCKKIKDEYGESAYIKSYNFKATGRTTNILHSPIRLGVSGSQNWLPFETTCTVVKPDGTITTSGLGYKTASGVILKRDISPIELTGYKSKCKELNSTPTPTPTPMESVKNPYTKPNLNLDKVNGVCDPSRGDSLKLEWYASVAKWVVSEEYLKSNPSWSIRLASLKKESVDKELLNNPSELQTWPYSINLKFFDRGEKAEKIDNIDGTLVLSLAKQYGFKLSDTDKTLQELCEK